MLDKKEVSWITHLNSVKNGYNIARGGSGGKMSEETKLRIGNMSRGRTHSDETKQKIKEHWKVRRLTPVSEETRKKQSLVRKGKAHGPISEETRQKLRAASLGKSPTNKGKPHSDETKRKISMVLMGKKYGPMSQEHKENLRLSNVGKKRSLEFCQKMSEIAKRRYKTEEGRSHIQRISALGCAAVKPTEPTPQVHHH